MPEVLDQPDQFGPIVESLAGGLDRWDQMQQPRSQDGVGLDIAKGLGHGVVRFGQGIGSLVDSGAELFGADLADDDLFTEEAIPEWLQPHGTLGGLASGVTQFGLSFIPIAGVAGRAAGAFRATSLFSKVAGTGYGVGAAARLLTNRYVASSVIGGAINDFLVTAPDQDRLSDVLVGMGGIGDNPVTRWLATDSEDSFLESRAKSAIEGALTGVVFDGVLKAGWAGLKAVKRASFGKAAAEASSKAPEAIDIEALFQDPKGAAERGLISPDLAIKLADTDWSDTRFDLTGPARGTFSESLRVAVGEEEAPAILALTDSYAKMLAASRSISTDDAYRRMFAAVRRAEAGVEGDLFQGDEIPELLGPFRDGRVPPKGRTHGQPQPQQDRVTPGVSPGNPAGQRAGLMGGDRPGVDGGTPADSPVSEGGAPASGGEFGSPANRSGPADATAGREAADQGGDSPLAPEAGSTGSVRPTDSDGNGSGGSVDDEPYLSPRVPSPGPDPAIIKQITNTPAFREWFGDSKVRDANGQPLVLFHGTHAHEDFSVFGRNEDGTILSDVEVELGGHFGTNQAANDVLDGGSNLKGSKYFDRRERIYPVFLSIRNPITTLVDDFGVWDPDHVLGQLIEQGLMTKARQQELKRELRNFAAREERWFKRFNRGEEMEGPFENGHTINTYSNALVIRELKKLGFDGIRYLNQSEDKGSYSWIAFDPSQIKSVYNRGTFDPGNPSILFQGSEFASPLPRGSVKFLEDGRAVINLFKTADRSTLLHETAHVFRRHLGDIDSNLLTVAEKWAGVEAGQKWGKEAEEKFARAFEAYVSKGEAPTEELKSVFERFRDWLTAVYQGIVGSPVGQQVSPEIRDVFDSMLGKDWNRANPAASRPTSRPPNRASARVRAIRDGYNQTQGTTVSGEARYTSVDDGDSEQIAQAFQNLAHDPKDPEVYAAYQSLRYHTLSQYDDLKKAGIRIVPWAGEGEPYASAQAMIEDLEANGRLYFKPVRDGTPGHPLLVTTGETVYDSKGQPHLLSVADVFRAVHEVFGRAADGYAFGPEGDRLAWLAHARSYGDIARRALATEVHGVGQKAALMPEWASNHSDLKPLDALGPEFDATVRKALKSGVGDVTAIQDAFGHHINVGRLAAAEDVIRVLRAVEATTSDIIHKRVGKTRTLAEIQQTAEEFGDTAPEIIRQWDQHFDAYKDLAAKMVAARALRNAKAEQLSTIAQRLLGEGETPNPDTLKSMAAVASELLHIDTIVGSVQRETARTVTSGNITVGSATLPEPTVESIVSALKGEVTPGAQAAVRAAAKAAGSLNFQLAAALVDAANPGRADANAVAQVTKVAQAITAAASTAGPVGVARMVRNAAKAKEAGLFDAFLEFHKASILSGLPTFVINGLSGGVNTFLQATARLVGSAASLDGREVRQSFRLMTQLFGAAGDMVKFTFVQSNTGGPRGFRSVWDAFQQEKPILTSASGNEITPAIKAETFGLRSDSLPGRAVNVAGKWGVRMPFRLNQSTEEMWGQLNYLAYIRTKALDHVESAVWDNPSIPAEMKPAAAMAAVDQYVKDAFDQNGAAAVDAAGKFLHAEAARYAQSVNFTQDLVYGLGQTLIDAKTKHPWLDLVVPFVKVPTNIIRTAIRYTPGLNLVQDAFQRRLLSRSRDEVLRARGEMLMGAAFWSTAALMAANGYITGGGPLNPEERRLLMDTGWKAYSFVRTGPDGKKEYIEFRRMDPIASVFGIAADFAEASAYLDDDSKGQIATAAVLSLSNNFTSRSYLTGLTEALRAVVRPDLYAEPFLQNRLAALIPTFFGRAASADDTAMRETRSLLDAFRRRIPGLSADLPPRRNLLGQVVTPPAGYLPFIDTTSNGSTANVVSRLLSPAALSREVDDGVVQELARLQHVFSPPPRTWQGLDLTTFRTPKGQEAFDRLLELTGTVRLGGMTLGQRLSRLMSSSRYQRLQGPESRMDRDNPRAKEVLSAMSMYRAAAKRQLLREIPALRAALRQDTRVTATPSPVSSILQRLSY